MIHLGCVGSACPLCASNNFEALGAMASSREIEAYINEGGAAGIAEKAVARGNRAAILGVQAAGVMAQAATASAAGATATGVGATVATTLSTAITGSSVAAGSGVLATAAGAATVPVVGWVIAGVLVVAAGGIIGVSRRRAKFLRKDKVLLTKYIRQYERKDSEWRFKETKQVISKLQLVLSKRQSGWRLKQKAKYELQLEALFFIYKDENWDRVSLEAQQQRTQELIQVKKQNLLMFSPVYIGLILIGLGGIIYGRRKS